MTNLPSKYKHLRLMLTRGAKAVSTKEMFAVNQKAQPSPADGVMKMVSTMYKAKNNAFEEKTYKLSLIRINPRAMREKEKKIGTTYINMADFVSPDPAGINEETKLTMKVSESSTATDVTLSIKSHWLRNFKGSDGDAMSDMTGMSMETSSVATSNTSLNSVDEEDELDLDHEDDDLVQKTAPQRLKDDDDEDDDDDNDSDQDGHEKEPDKVASRPAAVATPAARPKREGSVVLSPTAEAAVSGDIQALRDALIAAKSDAQWTSDQLKDTEKLLATKEAQLKESLADVARLEHDLQGAMTVQEELMEENERAEAEYEKLLHEVEAGASKSNVDASQVEKLKKDIERLKSEAVSLKDERDSLKLSLGEQRAAADAAEKAERESTAKSAAAAQITELESGLAREKAKAAKFKSWLEQMTEQKTALENDLTQARDRLADVEVSNRKKGGGGGDERETAKDKEELTNMAAEMERISMQLVTASLGHAQAEQDRLEAKQQVYKLKEANRKLRERLTQVELDHAKAY
eukprot:CAMPEP_0179467440 /NCGR_PEP_ID=MMETSP0799-20121207/48567_1 /TAXON_ID=46947 /ORGANISM="Geminigera cryophila, Strain CCMP2564" /LENGTH=520 /DNA_ID=CAMNT_0021272847 /DNA_START=232 /DNA_END=1794 /DNA_ORIENTATION=+